jgi:DHA1 family bicyclomycin/chloramphenicol resistance-like MFS transporter
MPRAAKGANLAVAGLQRCGDWHEKSAQELPISALLASRENPVYASPMRNDDTIETAAGLAVRRTPSIVTLVVLSAVSPLAINIFLPSMPAMARDFGTSYATIQLGLSLYLAMTAILQIIAGPLSDFYGRRPVILVCLAIFLAGVALSLTATSPAVFIAGRVLQAASAAGIVLSRAIVRDLYEQERAASMIGYVTMGMAVAPMIGPAIGGLLDARFGWQASFWILFALGAIAFALASFDLPETNRGAGAPVSAQFGAYGDLFDSASYWMFALAATLASAVFFAFIGGAPAIASGPLAMAPWEYGLWFSLCALGYMTGNFISGLFSQRAGVMPMVLAGALMTLAGASATGIAYLSGFLTPFTLFAPMLLVGIGNGMTLPNATAAAVSIRPDAAGAAAGLLGALQIGLGAAASVAAGIFVSGDGGVGIYMALLIACGLGGLVFAALASHVAR